MSVMDSINYGYSHLEPALIGLMALSKNILLIGRHGLGKSRVARTLTNGYGSDSCGTYDATKDDLISIAGIPNPRALKAGRLEFTPHDRSIWNKTAIVVDEITRASHENQNLWLEMLEERTCFGQPLRYRSLIATANPESYVAALRMDDALLDRFHAVLPVPDFQDGLRAHDIERMMHLAQDARPRIAHGRIAGLFAAVQATHERQRTYGLADRVFKYCAAFSEQLLLSQSGMDESERTYISPRTYARSFPETVLAVTAYNTVIGLDAPVERAAVDSVRYCLASRYRMNEGILLELHESLKGLLVDGTHTPASRIRYALRELKSFEDRLEYLEANADPIRCAIPTDEVEKFLSLLLDAAVSAGGKSNLVRLRQVLGKIGYEGDILRQVDGNLRIALSAAAGSFISALDAIETCPGSGTGAASDRISRFKQLVDRGEFYDLWSQSATRLKTLIMEIDEQNTALSKTEILHLFSSLDLE